MNTTSFVETRTARGFYIEADTFSYFGIGNVLGGESGYIDGVLTTGKVKVTELASRPGYWSLRTVGKGNGRRTVHLLAGSKVIVDGNRFIL